MNAIVSIKPLAAPEVTEGSSSSTPDTLVHIHLGRSIPTQHQFLFGAEEVPLADVDSFVRSTVAHYFPNGWTITYGDGGRRDRTTRTTSQYPVAILEVVVNWANQKDHVRDVAILWKLACFQEAVLVTRAEITADLV